MFEDPFGTPEQEPVASESEQNTASAEEPVRDADEPAASESGESSSSAPEEEKEEKKDTDEEDWKGFYNFHPGYTPPPQGQPPKRDHSNLIVGLVCVFVFLGLIALAVIGILGLGVKGFSSLTGSSASSSTVSETTSSQSGVVSPGETPSHSYTSDDLDLGLESVVSSTDGQTGVIIAKKVCPSIVGVINYEKTRGDYLPSSSGSGIILSEDGFIITNQHVIAGADKVTVSLFSEEGMNEGDSYVAEVVGQDETTDLALLKIEKTGLTPASFADSDQVQTGEIVYAIGNPGGFELYASISQGLVSGVNRWAGEVNFIQTDVAINPGNSGGALVNVYGQVIGITSEKIVTVSDVSAEGLGFAIPTRIVMPVLDDLLSFGYVRGRPALRITVNSYSDAYAAIEGWPEDCRLEVDSVAAGSNAEKAGLKAGQFITKVDGVDVRTMDELKTARDKHKIGEKITLTVYDPSTKKTTELSFILEEDSGS